MKMKFIVMAFVAMFVFSSCNKNNVPENPNGTAGNEEVASNSDEGAKKSDEFIKYMLEEKFEEAYAMFNEDLKTKIPLEDFSTVVLNLRENYGEIKEIGLSNKVDSTDSNRVSYDALLKFEKEELVARVSFLQNDLTKLSGIYFLPGENKQGEGAPEVAIPENVVEEDIIVGKGTEFELKGKLTLPKENAEKLTAVVLVQGSGSSDMDEAIYKNKPFRDIAYSLASQGIAVIRYDKRTFSHFEKILEGSSGDFTVKSESIDDAVLAKQLLENDERIDKNNIFVIGHSLGGMVAPRITEQGDFAGMVIMAGTTRSLIDLIYDQNIYYMDAMDLAEEGTKTTLKELESEYEKYQGYLKEDKELHKKSKIFNQDAYYFLELDSFDGKKYFKETKKPVFALQGSKDFQVTAEKDFVIYEEIAKSNNNIKTKLYDGLNHLFMKSETEKPTMEEYEVPQFVDETVLKDIGDWLKEVKK